MFPRLMMQKAAFLSSQVVNSQEMVMTNDEETSRAVCPQNQADPATCMAATARRTVWRQF